MLKYCKYYTYDFITKIKYFNYIYNQNYIFISLMSIFWNLQF